MRNICIVRIDDRLIHGQVVTAWIKRYPINRILIIDNVLSTNRLMSRIYTAAAPIGVNVLLMDNEKAISFLKEPPLKDEQIMILVKEPVYIEELLDQGIVIEKLILGGMGTNDNRKTLIKNVAASEKEKKSLRKILSKGVSVVYQLVPSDKPVNIESLL